jgi:hypothetical protein
MGRATTECEEKSIYLLTPLLREQVKKLWAKVLGDARY